MNEHTKAYMIGAGIGNLAAAAFMIRDGGVPGSAITIIESQPVLGGSLDGAGDPDAGYSLRGGRMLTSDNYECTWDLFKSIPSLEHPGKSVYQETVEFNERHHSHARARLVDKRRAKLAVEAMGFSMQDRMELLNLTGAEEDELGDSRISDWLSPHFFETAFWLMWATTFAFQPWHSAVEFKRYIHRFMKEFARIETLGGVKRTVYNQYDSMVRPLQHWLTAQGVRFMPGCTVTDIASRSDNGQFVATALHVRRDGQAETLSVEEGALVFFQNASMTDASSLGSMRTAPAKLNKNDSGGWTLWEKLADARPEFGNPAAFNRCISESWWESFTVTLKDKHFFQQMTRFSDNQPGTGGLVTFKDSNWLLSVVLPHQPYFADQPAGVQVFWGYALFPDRVGNYVAKPMAECNGEEILEELRGHLRFDPEVFAHATCIPCRMPYITSMFMPRKSCDRPLPVPELSKNLAFVSQYVEIPLDVVFTVEYSVRAAQMAVYQLLGIRREVPPVSAHDKSLEVQFKSLLKAFQPGHRPHPDLHDGITDAAGMHVWHDTSGKPGRI